MTSLIRFAFVQCLTFWAWFGWNYIWPVAKFYYGLLAADMGHILAPVGMAVTLTVVLWVYYAATANLKRVIDNGTAPLLMKVLGYTLVLPPMIALDWLLNMFYTVFFWDLPSEPFELVTGRLKRYAYETKHQGTKRQKVARIFALILDALDPSGIHV